MTKLADYLDAIHHERIRLQEDCRSEDALCHRPDLGVWACESDDAGLVVLQINSLWGQPARFVELSPDKARALASRLKHMADKVDVIARDVAAASTEIRCAQCGDNLEGCSRSRDLDNGKYYCFGHEPAGRVMHHIEGGT